VPKTRILRGLQACLRAGNPNQPSIFNGGCVKEAPVAQWIEYCPPKAGVAGSIPAGRTKNWPLNQGITRSTGGAVKDFWIFAAFLLQSPLARTYTLFHNL
jgi:hypothetical protein